MTLNVHFDNSNELPSAWALRVAIKESDRQATISTMLNKARRIHESRKKTNAGVALMSTVYDRNAVKPVNLDKIKPKDLNSAIEKIGNSGFVWQLVRECVS